VNEDTIGFRLKYLRDSIKATQKQVAEATGIVRTSIKKYEEEMIKPSADAIIGYSKYFNVSTDWILTGHERVRESVNSQDYAPLTIEMANLVDYKEEYSKRLKTIEVDEEEVFVILTYRDLNIEGKTVMKSMLSSLKEQLGIKKKEGLSNSEQGEEAATREVLNKKMA
jgi:transcriptional regulator with XRE-family HTH domain